MACITSIEQNRGLVTLYADGYAVLRISRKHFSLNPLREGDTYDPDTYVDAIAMLQVKDAYETALTSLDSCARTEKQIRQTLSRKGYVEPAIEAVLDRLKEFSLIDDQAYAERMAEAELHKPEGIYAFKRRLAAKGISEQDAQSALDSITDEQQQAMAGLAAAKLLRKYGALPAHERKAKLSQALARRGFSWDTISATLESLGEDPDDPE